MNRKLLVLKSIFKGKPVEMITKSDAEYITVRKGNSVKNLSQVLDSISKEIDSLNAFKRTFGFTKQDYTAMNSLKNMIDYMEDKDNASEIMNQINNINEKIAQLEKTQDILATNITHLADELTILQKELNNTEIDDSDVKDPDLSDTDEGEDNKDTDTNDGEDEEEDKNPLPEEGDDSDTENDGDE